MIRYSINRGEYTNILGELPREYIDILNGADKHRCKGITSFQGSLSASYKTLVDAFGKPTWEDPMSNDKVTCEWQLNIDGENVTIYDYKGDRWHVGGYDKCSYRLALLILKIYNSGCKPEMMS